MESKRVCETEAGVEGRTLIERVLIAGEWRESRLTGTFRAENPATREPLTAEYPVSSWEDCDAALDAAVQAATMLRSMEEARIAEFLEAYAKRIEDSADALVEMANAETGLPATPRLRDVELPRTTGQLRAAAAAARQQSWKMATIDTKQNIRSAFAPIGPVLVFGPNNFPFAFGSVSGGDFAAAIAAGNPVLGKANTSHPGTTRLFAVAAREAAEQTGMPPAIVQLIYRTSHTDGERLVSDPRVGATGYTGSRNAGLKLKNAADSAGKPIYLELSSVNPVVILPAAIAERGEKIADEFTTSCLMGAGQFCTNPGLVLLFEGRETDQFLEQVRARFQSAPVGTLLSSGVAKALGQSVDTLKSAGAEMVVGGSPGGGRGHCYANTLLKVPAGRFMAEPEKLQTEAFGNVSLVVTAADIDEAVEVIEHLEGNLTGSIYSSTTGADDELYDRIAPGLQLKVGRLLNDKMPTGVAVSPAMNHGGPYPATGHPGFTAVGIPASLHRFAVLQSYDNVRLSRLPKILQDKNPTGETWRYIDGRWTQADVGSVK